MHRPEVQDLPETNEETALRTKAGEGVKTLTAEDAIAIREAYLRPGHGGAGVTTLAARYRLSTDMVRRILKGEHALTRGMTDVCGKRLTFGRQAQAERASHAYEPSGRLSRSIPSAVEPKAVTKQRPCPTCKARKGEPCWRTTASYPVAIASFHPARKAQPEVNG